MLARQCTHIAYKSSKKKMSIFKLFVEENSSDKWLKKFFKMIIAQYFYKRDLKNNLMRKLC